MISSILFVWGTTALVQGLWTNRICACIFSWLGKYKACIELIRFWCLGDTDNLTQLWLASPKCDKVTNQINVYIHTENYIAAFDNLQVQAMPVCTTRMFNSRNIITALCVMFCRDSKFSHILNLCHLHRASVIENRVIQPFWGSSNAITPASRAARGEISDEIITAHLVDWEI